MERELRAVEDEGRAGQLPQRDRPAAGQGVPGVEHGAQLVADEGERLEGLLVGGQHHRSHVELVGPDQLLDLVRSLLAELERDARVGGVEGGQQRREEGHAHDGRRADAQPAAAQGGELLNLLLHDPHGVEDAVGPLEHHLPGVGEAQPAPLPDEQPGPQLLLHAHHHLADGGLGEAQRAARAGEALLPDHLGEDAKGVDVHPLLHS